MASWLTCYARTKIVEVIVEESHFPPSFTSSRSAYIHIRTGVALSAQHSFTALGPLPRWCGSEYGRYSLTRSIAGVSCGGVLIAYRFAGQDWFFTNVAGIHLSKDAKLIKIPNFPKKIEVIGDSLSTGQYGTFEGLSSYAWGLAEGLGSVEFDTTAYPGICLVDQNCWGNAHGQTYQWFRTPDTSSRAEVIYGDNPPLWDFAHHQRSDIVIINLGTNDNNTHNNVTSSPQVSESSDYIDLLVEWIQPTQRYRPEVQADTLYWNDEPNY
ncbi:hypothetical protein KCV06_g375, partial [Aureobasidium melanogenum]